MKIQDIIEQSIKLNIPFKRSDIPLLFEIGRNLLGNRVICYAHQNSIYQGLTVSDLMATDWELYIAEDEWICPVCEESGEMSIDDFDAPCQDCGESAADAAYDRMKEEQWD